MIKMEETRIEKLLQEGKNKLIINKTTQLISMTKKIEAIDPIVFYENAKKTTKDRIFWSSTLDDFYIVGVGNVEEMVTKDAKIAKTELQWKEMIDQAIIDNPYQVPGTGIVSLGGLAFDARKKPSALWEKFRPSEFRIPEFILTKYKGEYYYTVIRKVCKNDEIDTLTVYFDKIEQELLTPNTKLPGGAKIINRKEIDPKQWLVSVNQAIDDLKSERTKKIVLARELRLTLNREAETSVMLHRLLKMQPTSYVFAFEHGTDCFIGASPERLVKVEGEQLYSTCLAGTAPRGRTKEEDQAIAYDQLLNDKKNREEHDHVVQMIRNKIAHYCAEVNIPATPVIYSLKNLQHLYTPVTARLKSDYSIFNIIAALHPTPALGGVPREASLAFIREHELLDRGWYGAPIGWLDSNANGEFAVAIRSGLVQKSEVSLFAGCGIMKDSNPEAEYEETKIKFLPMLTVLEERNESY